MADKRTYHPHENTSVFWQVKNQRDFHKGDYHMNCLTKHSKDTISVWKRSMKD